MNKFRFTIILACLLSLFLSSSVRVYAQEKSEEKEDISITLEGYSGKEWLYNYSYDAIVKVKFYNMKLYSGDMCLSYHIYRIDDLKNAIVFENKRTKIELDKNNEAIINVPLELKSLSKNNKVDELLVQFDIVDQKNNYWVNLNDNIRVTHTDIKYQYDLMKGSYHVLTEGIKNAPFIFTINIVISISFIVGIIYVRKKEKVRM